jgi:hypothetical protein
MANSIVKRLWGRFSIVTCGVAWAAAVSVGLAWITHYQMTPGGAAAATAVWPGATGITLASDRATLVMFVHPQCPCSRSSLGELAKVMARRGDRVQAYVAFFDPSTQPQCWTHTDLWTAAQAIPGVTVLGDSDGALANHFHVITSGQVLLYNSSGRLLFTGGITDSRGHFGDNIGEDTIVSFLSDKPPTIALPAATPVYGCPITTLTPLKLPVDIDSKPKVCTP